MINNKLDYYKNLLLKERESTLQTINYENKNDGTNGMQDNISELSMYDNHPADVATEVFQAEMNNNLRMHEKRYLERIENALTRINNGTYGNCISCGRPINTERLDALPFSERCISCQNKMSTPKDMLTKRPSEETILKSIYKGNPHVSNKTNIFDEEDSWQQAASFNKTAEDKKALDWYDNNMYGD